MVTASEHLTSELYQELRRRAARLVHPGGSVAPTSLVHEAFEKLYHVDPGKWRDVVHFKATASMAMRQILLDRVKARGRLKRGGDAVERVSLSKIGSDGLLDLVELNDALEALAMERPQAAQVVQYRLLGGMDVQETMQAMGVSASTVKREWRIGRAYLLALVQT